MARYSQEFKAQLFEIVKRRDSALAVAMVNDEQARNPMPKVAFFRDSPDLEEVAMVFAAKPKLLGRVAPIAMESLRDAAAMAFLVGDLSHWRWLPRDLAIDSHLTKDAAVQAIIAYVQTWRNLKIWNEIGVVARVTFSRSNNPSCPSCVALDGRTWRLGSQPELPYEHCTNPAGCHCVCISCA
jgi:hypothetical protein